MSASPPAKETDYGAKRNMSRKNRQSRGHALWLMAATTEDYNQKSGSGLKRLNTACPPVCFPVTAVAWRMARVCGPLFS